MSSKLGESKLGSVQFATPGELDIDEEIREAVRGRAEEVMKSVYDIGEGSNWEKVLDTVLHEFEREHEVMSDIISGRFIDDASNRQLDLIGDMWQIERRTGEGDEHFRARIKTQLPRHTGRATIEEILNVSEILLRTSKERIHIEENFIPKATEDDFDDDELPDEWSAMELSRHEEWLVYQMGEDWQDQLPTETWSEFDGDDREKWLEIQFGDDWEEELPEDWDTMTDSEQEQWLADHDDAIEPTEWHHATDEDQIQWMEDEPGIFPIDVWYALDTSERDAWLEFQFGPTWEDELPEDWYDREDGEQVHWLMEHEDAEEPNMWEYTPKGTRDAWLEFHLGEDWQDEVPHDTFPPGVLQESWLHFSEGVRAPQPWEEKSDHQQQQWLAFKETQQAETEPWEPARFDIVIEEIVFTDAEVSVEDFEDLIGDVKPAGVRAHATIGEQFTHRSLTDFDEGENLSEKAYDGYDPETVDGYMQGGGSDEPASLGDEAELLDIGGGYADEITAQFTL